MMPQEIVTELVTAEAGEFMSLILPLIAIVALAVLGFAYAILKLSK